MQYQEISLQELIHYLEGSATDSSREHIERERQHNPDFAEEFEDWEAFLAESTSREEGIAKMKSFNKEWTETKVDTAVIEPVAKILQFDTPAKKQSNASNKRPLFLRLAIAACIILIAGTIISKLMEQKTSTIDLVNQGFAQEMGKLLSVKAGAELEGMESFDLFLTRHLNTKQHAQVETSLDSLLAIHPEESKYMLLQALNFSLAEKNDQAISTLSTLLKQTDNTAEFTCKVRLRLAMVYAKTGQKDAFLQTKSLLTSDNNQGYICTDLDATIRPSLDAISANF